jgi:replicative DNA helicase
MAALLHRLRAALAYMPTEAAARRKHERGILGVVLICPALLPQLRLRETHFTSARHRALLRAYRASWRRYGTVDVLTLRAELRRQHTYRIVGVRLLAALVDCAADLLYRTS